MRSFRFTGEQRALQVGVRDYLAGECAPEHVRATAERFEPDRARWKGLAELGVVGLTVPEEHGGLGLTMLDLVLPLEEAGYAALPEPLLEVTAVSSPLLAEAGGEVAATLLSQVADGERQPVAIVDEIQAHAPGADALLIWPDDEHLALGEQVAAMVSETSIDRTRPVGTARASGPTLLTGPAARRARAAARDRGALGAAAMLVGAATRMTDLAVAHARQRHQFGVPIGSFQAVKHHLSDALVRIELARPAVYRAAWSLTRDVPEASAHVSMAKVLATDAATFTAKAALQVHGAIGYTWEHDLHLWMEKVWSLAASYGTADDHRAHLRTRLLG